MFHTDTARQHCQRGGLALPPAMAVSVADTFFRWSRIGQSKPPVSPRGALAARPNPPAAPSTPTASPARGHIGQPVAHGRATRCCRYPSQSSPARRGPRCPPQPLAALSTPTASPDQGQIGPPGCPQFASSQARHSPCLLPDRLVAHEPLAGWHRSVSPPITKRKPHGSNPPSAATSPLRVVSACSSTDARPSQANGCPGHRSAVQGDQEPRPVPLCIPASATRRSPACPGRLVVDCLASESKSLLQPLKGRPESA